MERGRGVVDAFKKVTDRIDACTNRVVEKILREFIPRPHRRDREFFKHLIEVGTCSFAALGLLGLSRILHSDILKYASLFLPFFGLVYSHARPQAGTHT